LIKGIKNPAGQRYYDVESYLANPLDKPSVICYARVSSRKQSEDLNRQVGFLKSVYPHSEVITDVGSGLNFKRKGLQTLLDRLFSGDKFTLAISHRDRLCRFGFELFQYLVLKNGGTIVVLNNTETSPEQELTQDLLSILHIFSCRVYGLRKYSKNIKEDKTLPRQNPTEPTE
jgi:predicted site-specific integrase-resolvase